MEKNRLSEHKALETLAVLSLAAMVFYLVFKLNALIYIAAALLAIALFFKKLAVKIARLWLDLSELIGRINSYLLLGIIFYLFLTPISLLFRMFKNDPLCLKREGSGKTYWSARDHEFTQKDLENLW
ncbi:MAG: hypothetical protein EPN22_04625 [Nitrospirae bacterium]|nr:MAG: hypothetical protein EPN22_04625 [Nitrospirota bacterium]